MFERRPLLLFEKRWMSSRARRVGRGTGGGGDGEGEGMT